MTFCKIVLRGNHLRRPTEKMLKVFRDLSKNPFSVEWIVDGKNIEARTMLDVEIFRSKDQPPPERSLVTIYAHVLEKINNDVHEVILQFKIPQDPPFDLVGNVQQVYRSRGLKTAELIYHSNRGKYGYQKFLQDGTVLTNARSREKDGKLDKINKEGLPLNIEDDLDLNTSSTFVENVATGEFADFLKEHDLEF